MFCMKCGKPTEGEKILCPACEAARQPAPQELIFEAPQQSAFETPQQPAVELNLEAQAPAPKKKKKTGLIVAAVILLIAIGVAACGFLFGNWGEVLSFAWIRLTNDEKASALYVEEKALKESSLGGQSASAAADISAAELALTLQIGDGLTDLLEEAFVGSQDSAGVRADLLTSLKKLQITAGVNTDDDMTQMDIGLELNNSQLLVLRAILDVMGERCYLGIPAPDGVNDTYLELDLAALGLDMDELAEIMEESLEASAALAESMPSAQVLDRLIDKYVLLALKNIDEVEESSEKLDADGVEKSFTVYTYTIDEAAARKVCLAVLKEAEHDDDLRDVVEAFFDYYNYYMEQMYAADDYYGYRYYEELDADDFFDAIADLIEELEDIEPENDGMEFYLETYVDSTGKICGRGLSDSDDNFDISFLTVTKGSEQAFEAKMTADGVTVKFVGTGTKKGDKLTGTYKLRTMGQTLFVVELDSFDTQKGLGTVRLGLGELLQQQIEDELDSDVMDILGSADVQLELKLQEDGVEFSLLIGGKNFVSLGLSAKEVKQEKIEIPVNIIPVWDEYDLLDWAEQLDLAPIVKALDKAGIPEELTDALAELDIARLLEDALYIEQESVSTPSKESEQSENNIATEPIDPTVQIELPSEEMLEVEAQIAYESAVAAAG